MKPETMGYVRHYQNLWKQRESYGRVISRTEKSTGFYARQHHYVRSELFRKNWFSEYTDEMYDSALECLACYRWYIIPERLRHVSARTDTDDIDELLDHTDYSTSLIAEELFCMIDSCLESGLYSRRDLDRIRRAYNGLSGFEDLFVSRIVHWGSIEHHWTEANVQHATESIHLIRPDLTSKHSYLYTGSELLDVRPGP